MKMLGQHVASGAALAELQAGHEAQGQLIEVMQSQIAELRKKTNRIFYWNIAQSLAIVGLFLALVL